MLSICEFLTRFKSKLSNNGALDYGEIFVHTHNKENLKFTTKKYWLKLFSEKKIRQLYLLFNRPGILKMNEKNKFANIFHESNEWKIMQNQLFKCKFQYIHIEHNFPTRCGNTQGSNIAVVVADLFFQNNLRWYFL